MSAPDTACRKCRRRPTEENPPRKRWITTAGVVWAYKCHCWQNNNLTGRTGWREFAEKQAAKARAK